MPSLTIKGIPDDLIVRLRYRAEQHRRSVNSEVIVLIEEAQRHMPYVQHEAVSDHIERGRK